MNDVGSRCYLIAEIAQAHDGSLGTALAYIDAAARAGADAVKFQCHIASEESTTSEPWRIKFSHQDSSRFEYWKRMEFTPEQWKIIKDRCYSQKVDFICSPFSKKAITLLDELGVSVWKVASGEFLSKSLIDSMIQTRKPLWLSTGMVNWNEINQMVSYLNNKKAEFVLFQCTTAYPCPPEKIGLGAMQQMAKDYQCSVGLSDHSGTIFPGLVAAALGAKYLEVHVVFSRDCFGPDVVASITIDELKELRTGLEFINQMVNSECNKDDLASESLPMRELFSKSLVVTAKVLSGQVLTSENLGEKKPGTGIPSNRISEFLGKVATRELLPDEFLRESDID